VERVNGLWAQSFWGKNLFTSRRDRLRKSPKFMTWYETYAPPALHGMTVKQAADRPKAPPLRRGQIAQLPEDLPLTAGRIHFIRSVAAQGKINLLKEPWKVSKSLSGHYVWATIDVGTAELLLYHRRVCLRSTSAAPAKWTSCRAFECCACVTRLPNFAPLPQNLDDRESLI
jgi:hypothetical protein